jgi:hypothetical protein
MVEHANAVSEVKDSRLERKVMNVSLNDVTSRGFGRIVSRDFHPFAEVETYHFRAKLLSAIQKPALAAANIRANFPPEEILPSPIQGNAFMKNLPPARKLSAMVIQLHVLITVSF